MADQKTVSIRMPVNLIEKIKAEGKKETRSISNMALILISEALNARE